jgi:hypothetical protein
MINCSLCQASSEDTAIITAKYVKGEINICLECLAEGIKDTEPQKKLKETYNENEWIILPDLKEEIYGYKCFYCEKNLFSKKFPVRCECGFVNTQKYALENIRDGIKEKISELKGKNGHE